MSSVSMIDRQHAVQHGDMLQRLIVYSPLGQQTTVLDKRNQNWCLVACSRFWSDLSRQHCLDFNSEETTLFILDGDPACANTCAL